MEMGGSNVPMSTLWYHRNLLPEGRVGVRYLRCSDWSGSVELDRARRHDPWKVQGHMTDEPLEVRGRGVASHQL